MIYITNVINKYNNNKNIKDDYIILISLVIKIGYFINNYTKFYDKINIYFKEYMLTKF
jgi:hypothetical protein